MTDFFDWLTAGDYGLGTDRLREQFRLSQEEMRRTIEALAPAFLFALQRLSAEPPRWADFMRRVGALGLEPASGPASPADSIVGRLFGTDLLADAVARQASMAAGVSPDTIRMMMPGLALMTLQTMGRMANANGGWPLDASGPVVAEAMRRSANAVEAMSRPSGATVPGAGASPTAYLEGLFAEALRGSFPWMTVPSPSAGRPATNAGTGRRTGAKDNATPPFLAFAPLFDALAASTAALPQQGASSASRRDAPSSARAEPADPVAGFSRMLEAGRSMQETYALEMLALFDRHRS